MVEAELVYKIDKLFDTVKSGTQILILHMHVISVLQLYHAHITVLLFCFLNSL